MLPLAVLLLVIPSTLSLTCYNGMKLIRMQSVGDTVEECPASSYCYNMTASAAFVVDVVKAGCSTWRCMLARDKCISTTFQMVPVSLCCCSHDRCNVGGNAMYDSIGSGGSGGGGSSGGWGGGGGGGSDNGNENNGNNNNNNNYNGWGNNNDNQGEQASRGSWGSSFAEPDRGSVPSTRAPFSPKQIEDRFRDFDVDRRDGNNGGTGGEEVFEKVDWRQTTPSTRGGRNQGGQAEGREIELDG